MSMGLHKITTDHSRHVALYVASHRHDAAAAKGEPVTLTVETIVDTFGIGRLPENYAVIATASQPATVSVSFKSRRGFTLTVSPLKASQTLSDGAVDVIVSG